MVFKAWQRLEEKAQAQEESAKATADRIYYRHGVRAQHFTRPNCHNDLLTDYLLKYILIKGGRGGVKSFSFTVLFVFLYFSTDVRLITLNSSIF